jgi:hypothetical protein
VTYQDRKNISDDFSPAANDYPSDPADIEAGVGARPLDERWRAVLSGIFRLPWTITVAPIYEYGSGQLWTRRLGYDYITATCVSRTAPRASRRNAEEGPDYNSLSMRITKGSTSAAAGSTSSSRGSTSSTARTTT